MFRFRKKQKQEDVTRDYLSTVLKEAQIAPINLFLIGQYNYESEEHVDKIIERLSRADYASCHGLHDSQITNDIVVIYLAMAKDTCKVLVVFDPVELFDNPSLLGSVPVQDCEQVLKYTIRKEF